MFLLLLSLLLNEYSPLKTSTLEIFWNSIEGDIDKDVLFGFKRLNIVIVGDVCVVGDGGESYRSSSSGDGVDVGSGAAGINGENDPRRSKNDDDYAKSKEENESNDEVKELIIDRNEKDYIIYETEKNNRKIIIKMRKKIKNDYCCRHNIAKFRSVLSVSEIVNWAEECEVKKWVEGCVYYETKKDNNKNNMNNGKHDEDGVDIEKIHDKRSDDAEENYDGENDDDGRKKDDEMKLNVLGVKKKKKLEIFRHKRSFNKNNNTNVDDKNKNKKNIKKRKRKDKNKNLIHNINKKNNSYDKNKNKIKNINPIQKNDGMGLKVEKNNQKLKLVNDLLSFVGSGEMKKIKTNVRNNQKIKKLISIMKKEKNFGKEKVLSYLKNKKQLIMNGSPIQNDSTNRVPFPKSLKKSTTGKNFKIKKKLELLKKISEINESYLKTRLKTTQNYEKIVKNQYSPEKTTKKDQKYIHQEKTRPQIVVISKAPTDTYTNTYTGTNVNTNILTNGYTDTYRDTESGKNQHQKRDKLAHHQKSKKSEKEGANKKTKKPEKEVKKNREKVKLGAGLAQDRNDELEEARQTIKEMMWGLIMMGTLCMLLFLYCCFKTFLNTNDSNSKARMSSNNSFNNALEEVIAIEDITQMIPNKKQSFFSRMFRKKNGYEDIDAATEKEKFISEGKEEDSYVRNNLNTNNWCLQLGQARPIRETELSKNRNDFNTFNESNKEKENNEKEDQDEEKIRSGEEDDDVDEENDVSEEELKKLNDEEDEKENDGEYEEELEEIFVNHLYEKMRADSEELLKKELNKRNKICNIENE